MASMIRLRYVNEDMYIVLARQPSIKDVNGKKREVIPISIASFAKEEDILEDPPSPNTTTMLLYDDMYSLDRMVKVPIMREMKFLHVKSYERHKKGNILVLSTDSNMLINSHRVLQIVGALPSINGENIEDVRTAQSFIGGYNRSSDLAEFAKIYDGKIDRKNLVEILQSIPADTIGNKLVVGGKTDLVIASPALQANELLNLLKY